jgi:hypothetical protein
MFKRELISSNEQLLSEIAIFKLYLTLHSLLTMEAPIFFKLYQFVDAVPNEY